MEDNKHHLLVYKGVYGNSERPCIGIQINYGQVDLYELNSENLLPLKVLERLKNAIEDDFEIEFDGF
jgi:hypothetical protein